MISMLCAALAHITIASEATPRILGERRGGGDVRQNDVRDTHFIGFKLHRKTAILFCKHKVDNIIMNERYVVHCMTNQSPIYKLLY